MSSPTGSTGDGSLAARSLAPDAEVFVSDLSGNASVVVRARAEDEAAAEQLERDLRLRSYELLRAEGVYA